MAVEGDVLQPEQHRPTPEGPQEVRRFLPRMNPFELILMHDASFSMEAVREAALRLEAKGLCPLWRRHAARLGGRAEARGPAVESTL